MAIQKQAEREKIHAEILHEASENLIKELDSLDVRFSYSEKRNIGEHCRRIFVRILAKQNMGRGVLKKTLEHSLKKVFEALLDSLRKDYLPMPTSNTKTMKQTAKQRKSIFFRELTACSAAHWRVFYEELETLKHVFAEKKIELKVDPSLESFSLKLHGRATTEQEWKEKLHSLESLPMKDLLDLLTGAKNVF